MKLLRSVCLLCISVMAIKGWAPTLPEGRELTTNLSNMSLRRVPANLSPASTTLDLSYNLLFELQSSDFHSVSKLRDLILCHNSIQRLDLKIFDFNKELRYLDVSYNRLKVVTWYSLASLRHLDLSFNDFDTMPVCEVTGNMSHLETLGLSGAKIQKSDFQKISHLHLNTVFLGLKTLSHYEEGSLPILNTTKLHIFLPMNVNFWVLLYDGLKTSKILEMTNIDGLSQFLNYEPQHSLILENSKTSILLFNKVSLLWNDLFYILHFVWHTLVEYFQIKNVTFGGKFNFEYNYFNYSNTTMKAIKLEHVHFRIFQIPQERIYLFFTKMGIENLTISDAQMPHILFPNYPTQFQYLNFANNILTDELFKKPTLLPSLKTLILKGNRLETLSLVSHFVNLTPVMHLDLSQNLLQHQNDANCSWPDTLLTMNLSFNKFADSVFRCLPRTIQVLELNNNKIQTIPKAMTHLQSLRELNIAFNFLTDLPGCSHFRKLSVLNIEMNLLFSPSLNFLQSCQEVKTLNVGKNPFWCTCDLRDFIQFGKYSEGMVVGWSDLYICEYPLNLKGTQLKDVYLPEFSCNTVLFIVTLVIIVLMLGIAVAFSCLRLDLPWYLRMLGQWVHIRLRAAEAAQEPKRTVKFHAFIAYSEHDSLWVKNALIPSLEKEDGSVLICTYERNFDPIKSRTENIMNCIEKSYKSIFVLSPNFVQHEWCHYEEIAHHEFFHENSEHLIFILLEVVPLYCIPTRYHKLRTYMEKKALLEWPKSRHKCRLILANLRAIINVNLSYTRKTHELQTFTGLNEQSRGSAISLIRTDCL
ncbi:toll-like receptor 10 [Ochotona princeps]|uniref:toll-like receptor 10 n=1 Tax=Ochotona princeps TaxID=9978 RepID=UPI0027151CEC|nr:toll-like receptor 10 [Ochotona princeps]